MCYKEVHMCLRQLCIMVFLTFVLLHCIDFSLTYSLLINWQAMTVGLLLIFVLVYYAYLSCICVCVFVYSCTLGSDKRVLWTHSMMVWTFVYHVCVVVCRCMCICLFMCICVCVYIKVHEWHAWLLFCSGE